MLNPELDDVIDESVEDTAIDMANYLLIEVMERRLNKPLPKTYEEELPF